MLPQPLHPAIVHFPIVLAFLLPLVVGVAWFAVRRGVPATRAWTGVVAFGALLFFSAWLSVRTGNQQEERVEDAISAEQPLHAHEEAAERFLVIAGIALALLPLGLAGGRLGQAGRVVSAVASLGLIAAVYPVGKSGGELVYEHGAAQAYVGTTVGQALPGGAGERAQSNERRARERNEGEEENDR
jgi:uncharacterized membrane protein